MFSNVAVLWAVVLVLMCCIAANAGDVTSIFEIPAHILGDNSGAKKRWRGKEVCIEGIVNSKGKYKEGLLVEFACIREGFLFEYRFWIEDFSSLPKFERGQTVLMAGIVRGWDFHSSDDYIRRVTIDLRPSRIVEIPKEI